ncbi:DUF397 domain-containing protein [Streptomyces sp. NPDC088768]|uniref:DUF397 domain-containing protein n=1 Tax=Streptomyces sp. NPDC088768 TaxID=3365894 RepID=UPI003817DA96
MAKQHIPDASALRGWRRSSYSGSQQGSCVEVVDGYENGVPVRDSKAPHGPALLVSAQSWTTFVALVKR